MPRDRDHAPTSAPMRPRNKPRRMRLTTSPYADKGVPLASREHRAARTLQETR